MAIENKHGCFKIGCGLVVAISILAAVSLAFVPRNTFERYFGDQPTKAELIADLGGDRVATVLQDFDRAHSVLLNPPPEGGDARNFPAASDEKPVQPPIASHIAAILLSPDQQRKYPPIACIPLYGVRISYFASDDRVDIYFCFECSLLAVYLNDQPVGGLHFPFSYRQLIAAVQRIYPDNTTLQKLAARRRD